MFLIQRKPNALQGIFVYFPPERSVETYKFRNKQCHGEWVKASVNWRTNRLVFQHNGCGTVQCCRMQIIWKSAWAAEQLEVIDPRDKLPHIHHVAATALNQSGSGSLCCDCFFCYRKKVSLDQMMWLEVYYESPLKLTYCWLESSWNI